MDPLEVDAAPEAIQDQVEAVRGGRLEAVEQRLVVAGDLGGGVELARAHRLRERLAEGPPDRHRLADRLHVGGQPPLAARELLEGESRDLRDDVVDRRLERGRRRPGDVVGDLVERVADGEPGGDLRDREAGRLRCERRRPRDPRVHLDDDDLAGLGIDAELDVRAAGLDADGADHRDRLVAELLVERVAEALRRRHRHRVAGVDAHRVDVLDRADDDHVVVSVPHQLELELAPAEHRLLDEDLVDRARGEALGDDLAKLRLGCRGAAALAAHRERGPDDRRQRQRAVGERGLGIGDRLGDQRPRHPQPRRLHRPPEGVAVLGPVDRVVVGSDQLHPEPLQGPVVVQRLRQVEGGLTAQRRQQRVGALALDDRGHDLRHQRLDVGAVGELRVGHDRGRVRVDEDDLVALLAQHLARLRPRVVELRRLPDHDRPRADQEDLGDVVALRHRRVASSLQLAASRLAGGTGRKRCSKGSQCSERRTAPRFQGVPACRRPFRLPLLGGLGVGQLRPLEHWHPTRPRSGLDRCQCRRGSRPGTLADQRRLFLIARGSLHETEHWLERAARRDLPLSRTFVSDTEELGRVINGLIKADPDRAK